jgi:hypothetical protein
MHLANSRSKKIDVLVRWHSRRSSSPSSVQPLDWGIVSGVVKDVNRQLSRNAPCSGGILSPRLYDVRFMCSISTTGR